MHHKIVSVLLLFFIGGRMTPAAPTDQKTYSVAKLHASVEINAEWDKTPWISVPANELSNWMGDYPEHFPKVLFKVAYDDEALYIIWQVHDQYIVANFHLPQFFGYLEFGDRTDVGTRSDEQPSPLAIRAFPDPFNVQTTIQYRVTRPCDIRLDVANINGQVVKTLASGHHDAGTFNASFDASLLPSGVYICSLTDGNSQVNKRITLAK